MYLFMFSVSSSYWEMYPLFGNASYMTDLPAAIPHYRHYLICFYWCNTCIIIIVIICLILALGYFVDGHDWNILYFWSFIIYKHASYLLLYNYLKCIANKTWPDMCLLLHCCMYSGIENFFRSKKQNIAVWITWINCNKVNKFGLMQ